jgi:hypothetical protein
MAVYSELIDKNKGCDAAGINWTPSPDGVEVGGLPAAGTVRVVMGRAVCAYVVVEFPTGWDGRGFHLAKLATASTWGRSGR